MAAWAPGCAAPRGGSGALRSPAGRREQRRSALSRWALAGAALSAAVVVCEHLAAGTSAFAGLSSKVGGRAAAGAERRLRRGCKPVAVAEAATEAPDQQAELDEHDAYRGEMLRTVGMKAVELFEKLTEVATVGDIDQAEKYLRPLLAILEEKRAKRSELRVAYNCAIKACANIGNPKRAEAYVEEMESRGLVLNRKGFGKVMEAFAKAADLPGAEKYFKRLQATVGADALAYNLLLDAAARSGDLPAAERLFKEMSDQGFVDYQQDSVNALNSVNSLLNAAASVDMAAAKRWYEELSQIVPMDMVSFNTLARGAAERGDLEGAEGWFEAALAEGLRPDYFSYTAVVQAAGRRGDAEAARRWLEHAVDSGLELEISLCTAFIKVIASVSGAASVKPWLEWFREHGVEPNSVLYVVLLNEAANQDDSESAQEFVKMALESGGPYQVSFFNALLKVAGMTGDIEAASNVLTMLQEEEGVQPDEITLTSLINVATEARNSRQAKEWYDELVVGGVKPQIATVNALIKSQVSGRGKRRRGRRSFDRDEMKEWLDGMVERGVKPNERTYGILCGAAAEHGDAEGVEFWRDQGQRAGVFVSDVAGSGGRRQANDVDDLKSRAVHYTFKIKAAIKGADPYAALVIGEKAISEGAYDDLMLVTLIRALGDPNRLFNNETARKAQEFYDLAVQKGWAPAIFLDTALLSAYVNQDMEKAEAFFREMSESEDASRHPNRHTWHTLLGGYARNSDNATVLVKVREGLERMEAAGLEPDAISFQYMLMACSRSGTVGKQYAEQILHHMVKDRNLEPISKNLWELKAMFGQKAAFYMVTKLGFEPKQIMQNDPRRKTKIKNGANRKGPRTDRTERQINAMKRI